MAMRHTLSASQPPQIESQAELQVQAVTANQHPATAPTPLRGKDSESFETLREFLISAMRHEQEKPSLQTAVDSNNA